MTTEHYKASSEPTDANERALVPALKRTQPRGFITQTVHALMPRYCEECGCEITIGQCKHGVSPQLAQDKPQPSPLPWKTQGLSIYSGDNKVAQGLDETTGRVTKDLMLDTDIEYDEAKANARLIVASVNHADKLAEALRDMREGYQRMFDVMPVAWQTYDNIAESTLKAWEDSQ
jgi:hypothetical protein